MTHAGHRAYKKVDQRNRPCDLPVIFFAEFVASAPYICLRCALRMASA